MFFETEVEDVATTTTYSCYDHETAKASWDIQDTAYPFDQIKVDECGEVEISAIEPATQTKKTLKFEVCYCDTDLCNDDYDKLEEKAEAAKKAAESGANDNVISFMIIMLSAFIVTVIN